MLICIVLCIAAGSDFQMYLSFLPDAVAPYLDKVLDWDNEYDRDLIRIAEHMLKWEEHLALPFRLTPTDIDDIKAVYPQKPELQR